MENEKDVVEVWPEMEKLGRLEKIKILKCREKKRTNHGMIDSYLLSTSRYVEIKVDICCIDKTDFIFYVSFSSSWGGGDG